MLKAVLDSTVLVSAFLRFVPGGVSHDLLRFAEDGTFDLCLSESILEETARALIESERNRRLYTYTEEDVVEYCQGLTRYGAVVTNVPDVHGVVRDPNDDMIIACAIAAGADYIVTRDKDLLSLGSYEGIEMIKPEAFLHVLRAQLSA
jgi:putative PIN family toxin of toxin-antitoxin system